MFAAIKVGYKVNYAIVFGGKLNVTREKPDKI